MLPFDSWIDRSIPENNDPRARRFEIVLYTHMYTRIHIYLPISLIESKVERVLFRYDHQRNFSTMDTYMCIKYTFEEETSSLFVSHDLDEYLLDWVKVQNSHRDYYERMFNS